MKNKFLTAFFIVLVLSFMVYAEEDPFAGLDFESSGENTNTTAVSEPAGAGNAAQPETDSSDDILALIESDSSQSSEQVLFPEETAASNDSAAFGSSSDIDSLFFEAGISTTETAKTTQQEKAAKPEAKKSTPPKWVVRNLTAVPATGFIYTKDGHLGMFRNLKDHLVYKIKTSSGKTGFGSMNINDHFADTAWVDNGKNEGIGEDITFTFQEITFAPVYEKKYRAIEVNEIKILNGFCKDEETWLKYNRIKNFKMLLNNQVKYNIALRDSKNWQSIKLPVPVTIKSGDKITFKITDIYPDIRNARIANTAISEISLIGGPTGAKVENKYIASQLLTE